MMSIPFFLFAGALAAAFYGKRRIAIGLWVLGLVCCWSCSACTRPMRSISGFEAMP